VFLGPPGTGKTHLAIGLGIRACQAGHRVLFATAAEWVARLADAPTPRTGAYAEAAYQQAQADLAGARADLRDAKKDVTAANRIVVTALARLEKVTRQKR
jgi:UDP:flavonoid glycosyltransferase YjiC (YdhE family)